MTPHRPNYLSNTAFALFDRIFRIGLTVLVGAWVARYLGPKDYGLLSYTLSFVGLFGGLVTLGIDSLVIKDLVNESFKREAILGTAFILRSAVGLLAFVLLSVTSLSVSLSSIERTMILILGTGLLLQSSGIVDQFFQSQVRYKYIAYAQTACLLFGLFAKLFCILQKLPVVFFAAIVLAEAVVQTAAFLIMNERFGISIKSWRFDKSFLAHLARSAWPLTLSDILVAIYLQVDKVIVRQLMDQTSLGFYAAATSITTILYFFPMAILTSLYPALVHAKKNFDTSYTKKIEWLFGLLFWSAFFLSGSISLLSPIVVKLLLGKDFAGSAAVLSIHIWSLIPVFLGVLTSHWLIVESHQWLYPIRIGISILIQVSLTFLLVPRVGATGAAYAYLASQVFSSSFFLLFRADTRPLFFLQLRSPFSFPLIFRKRIMTGTF